MSEPKVTCYTPAEGRNAGVNIPKWKYDCIRRAILDVLDESETAQIRFKDLNDAVRLRLTSNQLAKLGSVGWHVTTVKLNMEVEGELVRVHGARPQTLRKGV
ncbi:hypothetical protein GCM10011309_18840 [Litorimonas cladophorae]|uniref:Uncharacterized protein n=1 Tax=Litorimonas cladophorae TaxID=1220491 RepID=A0A918KQ63_9PROT|nr:hypothetical protein [Litorimonas cladophorae]GGX69139.1 hypothetical protein GCM10011309_18840 [Litorimonas cladophorae]